MARTKTKDKTTGTRTRSRSTATVQPIKRAAPPGQEPIVESKFAEIYPADVERVEQNYISSLPEPESIFNVNCFIGLLFQLHRELVRPVLYKSTSIYPGNNGIDIYAADAIFYSLFIPLIARYKITPTMGLFMYLTGLTTGTVDSWKRGINNNIDNIYIDDNDSNDIDNNISVDSKSNNNQNKLGFYLKWQKYIEQWILQNTVSNNSIGSMFALKAVYGYSDVQTVRVEAQETRPQISASQLERIAEAAPPPPIGQD